MSKNTIAAKSLTIRNETQEGKNDGPRIADVLDDIKDSFLEAPENTGFYFLGKGGAGPSWTPINAASYYLPYWDGSGFRETSVYYHAATQRLGIKTGNTSLDYDLEVNGSGKFKTLTVSDMPNAQGDPAYTRAVVINSNGELGYENKSGGGGIAIPFVPKVEILSFSSDSTNYIVKVIVSGILGPWTGTPFRITADAVNNPTEAIGITYETYSTAGISLPTNNVAGSATSIFFILKFPKSSNTGGIWGNTYDAIMLNAMFLGCHNADVQDNIVYSVPRVGVDSKIKIKVTV